MTNTVTSCNTVNLLDKSTYDQQTRPDTELWAVDEESDSDYKSMVVGWGMPDYNAGVSVSVNTTFTPTADGVIEYRAYCSSSGAQGFYISEDDSSGRRISGFTNAASGYIHQMNQVSVVKGKTYYVYCAGTAEYVSFYPYKGA